MVMTNSKSNHPAALEQYHHVSSSFGIIAGKSYIIVPQHCCRNHHVLLTLKNKSDAFIIARNSIRFTWRKRKFYHLEVKLSPFVAGIVLGCMSSIHIDCWSHPLLVSSK